MAKLRSVTLSFGGGEVSPEMFDRVDDPKRQTGLATCRNWIVKPQGPAENRPGFGFVREVKNSEYATRLIPFTFSTTQTMVIELGAGYFRFHTEGATLMDDDVPYEVENPYAAADLFGIHYVQSADVLTLVHPSYAPRELRRLGVLEWVLAEIDLSPVVAPPAEVVATSSGHGTNYNYAYVVTTLDADGIVESSASESAECRNNIFATGAKNTVSWSAADGAARYNVYKRLGGMFGYIGQTADLSLVDDNIDPDLSKTPPVYDLAFNPAGILSVEVTDGGEDYATEQNGGAFESVTVVNGGGGYGPGTKISVSDPTGSGAVLSISVAYESIQSVTVVTAGTNYSSPTLVLYDTALVGEDGTTYGSGAVLDAVVAPIIHPQPTLAITDTTGSGAILSPTVVDGEIVGVRVIAPGRDYTDPVVTVDDAAGGTGATFAAPVLSGVDYPGAVSYFEQRRCFAGTALKPQNIWMTRSGTESNMSYSLPVRDDDRIAFRVAAREANTIRHIVPLSQLLLLTAAAEWRVTSVNSDAITPTTISVHPQSYIGASNVQPVIVNNTVLYGSARGGHMRELAYNWQAGGFMTGDLSLRASHLFDGFDVVDLAYAKAPTPVAWAVRSDGVLLGITYIPEQQIGAWHWHTTDGHFESCAVVAEGAEDVLYCVVRRQVDGATVRYVERMHPRADDVFADSALMYSGDPVTSLTGLDHLEGKTVSVTVNGAVQPAAVVTDGAIALEAADESETWDVCVGLPIAARLKLLPAVLMLKDGSNGAGHTKNVNRVWLRTVSSRGLHIGPEGSTLREAILRSTEPYGTAPSAVTQLVEVVLSPSWSDDGQIVIEQRDPVAATITSVQLEVATG
jgi:hypothetical protein